ncbi:hypothetical protein LCGC14_0764210 [marine sediment metagenome]|uniref:Uncharacterized protein n=1 Tax=marine sediment metagenome TaxID=412755 RepID=A0A0F9Q0F0_9ZZZZ
MKENYESNWGSPKLPPEDCSDNEIWDYALSFSGYTWTIDMHKEEKLIPILSEESVEFLDKHGGDWRVWDDKHGSAVLLTGCIASGRDEEDCSIEELRAALFMEQRSTRNSANWAKDEESEWSKTGYARELIGAIRKKI